jgi:hypothetical protein
VSGGPIVLPTQKKRSDLGLMSIPMPRNGKLEDAGLEPG